MHFLLVLNKHGQKIQRGEFIQENKYDLKTCFFLGRELGYFLFSLNLTFFLESYFILGHKRVFFLNTFLLCHSEISKGAHESYLHPK